MFCAWRCRPSLRLVGHRAVVFVNRDFSAVGWGLSLRRPPPAPPTRQQKHFLASGRGLSLRPGRRVPAVLPDRDFSTFGWGLSLRTHTFNKSGAYYEMFSPGGGAFIEARYAQTDQSHRPAFLCFLVETFIEARSARNWWARRPPISPPSGGDFH